jgi:two-component system chemotaxis response regulator CheB
MSDTLKYIIVAGASAGGLKALSQLVSVIPAHSGIAVFLVLHVSKSSTGAILARYIQKHTEMPCSLPEDGERIEPGHVYIGRPDFHMMVHDGTIRVVKGPDENRWRPSIDVLFRSAAAHYKSRAIGVILTGLLDDGTSGMAAIKRCGGITIVQEPEEAEFSDMPQSVLHNVEVDFRVPIADMGYILDDIFSKENPAHNNVPEEIMLEVELTEKMTSSIAELQKLGDHSVYSCPDCGGSLWSVKNEPVKRFRCYTGHVYYESSLFERQQQVLEDALWVGIRLLEERKTLLQESMDNNKHLSEVSKTDKQENLTVTNHCINTVKELLKLIADPVRNTAASNSPDNKSPGKSEMPQ